MDSEFLQLALQSFADAKAKGKRDWQTMELSVLKNRLLQRTHRQFRESDYGATTLRGIIERFPEHFSLGGGQQPNVSLLLDLEDDNLTKIGQQFPDEESDTTDVLVANREKVQEALDRYRKKGDNLGVGETHALQLHSLDAVQLEKAFVSIVAHWASSNPVDHQTNIIGDLLANIDRYVNDLFALAVVHATLRVQEAGRELPTDVGDLNYRIAGTLRSRFNLPAKTRPAATIQAATAKTKELQSQLITAVNSFCQSKTTAAKKPSTDVIKLAHAYEPYALVGERQILRDLEALLGTLFRKFCESCEKYEAEKIPRRASDLSLQLKRTVDSLEEDFSYRLKRTVVDPVARHMSRLIEEGTLASEEMMSPSVRIVGGAFKLDLPKNGKDVVFPARVINEGDGTAHGLWIRESAPGDSALLSVCEPSQPFDLAPGTERLIRLRLCNAPSDQPFELQTKLECKTIYGRSLEHKQKLEFEQQRTQPDWDVLLRNPPYTINPIKKKKDLYGRDSILSDLELHISNETSTFLWGQKRVGKTSVLQVLADNLYTREDIVCVVLRMGELASLHEGQLAHLVACRLVDKLGVDYDVAGEEEFRSGLGRLVPFVEELVQETGVKMLIIIDEFDDLNSAFYLGERGRQFVKALRSLSEVGLTFMFVGSERMNRIYENHSADLNKWVNTSLDRIEVEADCAALITEPVASKIEYEQDAVKRIVEYCRGNPFYMHLVAAKIFRNCAQEQRTFVGTSDFEYVHRGLVRELGPTNFAHFWEDVPVLDATKKKRSVAENCLFLACIATLGSGGYESLDDLRDVQAQLGLEAHERLPISGLRRIENGLLRRRVLSRQKGDVRGTEIELPVFRDWLLENGEADLLPVWRAFQSEVVESGTVEEPRATVIAESSPFPIDEDELLAVSERLVYLGKQKDVAEVRRWLRQFDDDVRIELGFALLKRLVERGFVNEGANVNGLAKMEDALNARRQDVGNGAWRIVRRRKNNLYLGHVDSDTKSGAATARELAKRMSPSKCGRVEEMRTWVRGHLADDPLLVVVDDFAGTGNTLVKGLARLWTPDQDLFTQLADEGRVICCLQTAFPEAIRQIKEEFPSVQVLTMTNFDDEVRAFSPEAQIFEDEVERKFAEEVMLQIGRQLVPQNPLGFGDMAALVSFHNTIPNNSLPVFWSAGNANGRAWQPLLPRGTYAT